MTISTVLVGTLLQATMATGAEASTLAKVPASEKPLSGHGVKMKPRKSDGLPRVPKSAPKHAWAKPGSATASLASGAKSASHAGDLPISLTPARATAKTSKTGKAGNTHKATHPSFTGKATVRVLDAKTTQHAGINGLMFTLQAQPDAEAGAAGVSVDYSEFAQEYGGSYAARLKLVRLPTCAATDPGTKTCSTATPLATDNDTKTHTLTANTTLPVSASTKSATEPMVLAATAGTSSDHGDYQASQLSPSSTWSTDLNSGSYSWSYNMPVPGVPGSFTPQVGLSYSSAGVDGRTANSNNQASWVGDGFNLWPGFIERSYKACSDDGITQNADGKKPGDLCWAYDNATISFAGHSGELIAQDTNSFRIKGDDGTKIDRIYGDSSNVRGNGAHNDEYWRVTTTDGTRYYFGYNRLPGYASGNEATDSAWTAPVYGDDDGEPCHASTFADSWCQQGWRWNLDYAVDTHGNAIAYYYNKETNYYARNVTASSETAYERGGYLDRIEYGLKSSAVYSAKPLAKVDFTSAERCLPQDGVTCDASTIDDKSFYWYDTPWDLNCKADVDCTKSISPTFWTRKRLTGVTTEVLQSDSTYAPIDSWTLDHKWGMADIDYQLLLSSIQHTGKSATPTITLPKVTFGYDQRANRLDIAGDDTSPFIKERLSTIADESGGQTDVTYSTAVCDAATLPTPETNTTRCYPVYFTKEGDADPSRQWFNKYVVDQVIQTDRTSSSPDMVTRYSYLGGAAWHYDDDDGLTKQKYKTWSSYRGYGHVRVQTGGEDPVGMKTQTDHYFLRGMDGDKSDGSGGTRTVTITDDNGSSITDHDSAAGFEYKTEKYSDPGGKVLSKTTSTPWHYETAKRVRSWGTTTANLTGTMNSYGWTSLDDGAGTTWRKTYTSYSHEHTAGRIITEHDAGDTSTAADNKCTRTTYADNTTAWILSLPAREETVAAACADTPDRSKDVLSDTRIAYDGQAYGTAPTKGDATRTATIKSHDGTTAAYLETESNFDSYGRVSSVNDLSANVTATETTTPVRTARTDGRTTSTLYTPTSGFATTVKVTGPPANPNDATTTQTSTTTYDTLRGLPTTVLDANNKRTDTTHDALGRNLKVWLPNRSKANSDTPNYEFTYTLNGTGPAAVGTKTLKNDGTQRTSYTLYDGFLRPRQTQAPGPDGGRLISDTFNDERGLTAKQFAPYYNTTAPSTDLLVLDDALSVETQTWNTYDGLGRIAKSQQVAGNGDGGKVLATTTTTYGGDRVSVTPPKGATPTTTVTDARGQTTSLLQYHSDTTTGTADTTKYTYNPSGKLASVTDPAGNTWTYDYDQRGHQTKTHDPDKGDTTTRYDDRDQIVSTTDARSKTITHVYDGQGRETETHDGDASGPLLTKRVWDPTGYKGQLASATRYVGGASGDAYTTTYSLYDNLYRPTRTTVSIPVTEGALAGSYQSNTKFNLDGTTQSSSYPAAGSLISEVLTPTYDDVMRVKTLTGTGGLTYVTDTNYSYTGKPLQYTYQAPGAKKTQVTNTYQWGTQRLDNTSVRREDVNGTDKSATYGYDEAGNITSIKDVARDGIDNQCYTLDYLGRLTDAWAQSTDTCAGTPSASVLGGPAAYWQSFTYDIVGNRKTETDHDVTGVSTKDVTHTYSYPAAGATQPHALSQVDTTSPSGVSTDSYTYDNAGNTHTRTIDGDKQTLDWDSEGHLAKVTADDGNGGTKTTSYLYGADGNRLIRRTDAATTLYLGATELTLAKGATTPKATRYYDLGGGTQAIRTDDNKLSFLIGDHHGTAELAVNAADLTEQQRRSTPFGELRGSQPASWPGEKGFVGGTEDETTGLTHLGAREYDPQAGRFISVDPVMDLADPQQINGYSYSSNNPVNQSDPTGQLERCGSGPCKIDTDGDGNLDTTDIPGNTASKGTGGNSGGGGGNYGLTTSDLVSLLPRTKNGWDGDRLAQVWVHYAYSTQGGNYWDASVGDGDRTAVACIGRDACGAAYRIWMKTHNLGKAKEVAATYCIANPKKCAVGEGAYENLKETTEIIPMLLSDGVGTALGDGIKKLLSKACSFRKETKVLLANGKIKSIDKIKPGDQVIAADPRTGKQGGVRTVTAWLVHHDNDLVELKVETKGGALTDTIQTTSDHPFWDETEKKWVSAGDLTPGHDLVAADSRPVELMQVRIRTGGTEMYNLTVEQLHTYYVLAGKTPVLVHNTCGASAGQTRMYVAGRPGTDTTPQAPLSASAVVKRGGGLQDGNYHYVVMPGGSVRAFHEGVFDSGVWAGHTSLSGGKPVVMAGTFDVSNGSITRFDNFSGHYRPGGSGMESVARDALNGNGFDVSGARWDPFSFG
ncbi:polymorphic toxin-type HINT domain-containing protein [Streptomyces sp. NBC_00063]|uniref:polymorphic toxin-type HINT domain-containing protein n=2 Tax=Streptomyces sp. NBC_00063 TaxID=2975638 RepID=UPI003D71A9E7